MASITDYLAAFLGVGEGESISDELLQQLAAAAESGVTLATLLTFEADDPDVWDGDPPTTLSEAVNRMAAVVGLITPIPELP